MRRGSDPVAAMRVAGFADDAGIVATAGEHEGHLGVREQPELVDGLPRRDVILLGADHEDRRIDVAQRDHPAIHRIAPGGEPVLEEQPAQVLRMHEIRHARLVGVPRHQVGHRLAFAQHIVLDDAGEDELVGTQDAEGARHLLRIQHALVPHHVFEKGHLAVIDEEHEVARLREVGLRGQQREGRQPLVAVARHGGRRDRQDRAAEAVAAGMDAAAGKEAADLVQRRHHALGPIIVKCEIAVIRRRVAPADHEHHVAAPEQEFHQRVLW